MREAVGGEESLSNRFVGYSEGFVGLKLISSFLCWPKRIMVHGFLLSISQSITFNRIGQIGTLFIFYLSTTIKN